MKNNGESAIKQASKDGIIFKTKNPEQTTMPYPGTNTQK